MTVVYPSSTITKVVEIITTYDFYSLGTAATIFMNIVVIVIAVIGIKKLKKNKKIVNSFNEILKPTSSTLIKIQEFKMNTFKNDINSAETTAEKKAKEMLTTLTSLSSSISSIELSIVDSNALLKETQDKLKILPVKFHCCSQSECIILIMKKIIW
jgi:hypothetical protein